MRCVHEASLHDENCYITLTYNEQNLPETGSLNRRDYQLFMKKLRKHLAPKKVRFKMCGEYGTNQDITSLQTIGRPHYHAIIFGHEFTDLEEHSTNPSGDTLYTSPTLDKLWGKGFCTLGEVTFESAAYVARYIMKKINGEEAEDHYETHDPATGESTPLLPEFTAQSNRPGIGRAWFDKYKHDLDKGFITMRGIKMPPPKYYNDVYALTDEENYMYIKQKKQQAIDIMDPDNTLDRLRVKEKIKLKRIKQLKRQL